MLKTLTFIKNIVNGDTYVGLGYIQAFFNEMCFVSKYQCF